MQDAGVNKQDAEPAEATWYLSRDGQQHGPLSDRELSLFAEGGNFQPGDLLWTAGLDEWKPADSIFGLAQTDDETPASQTAAEDTEFLPDDEDVAPDSFVAAEDAAKIDAAASQSGAERSSAARHYEGFEDDSVLDDPLDDHVGALAKALRGEAEPPQLSFQEQLVADLKTFGGFCAYLWAVFVVLTVHAVVGSAEYGVGLSFFVLTTINAFVLMRLMPLAERHAFFQNLAHKPLIYSIAYKTLFFVTALVLAYAVEMGVLGFAGIGDGLLSLGGGLGGMLAWWLIFSVALFPYFAFREVEAAVGADMMRKLLLGRI
ncbi:DUF4339 domain-containing protein [Methyloceanibacter caenitepidi]|uniref:GYF domain-containing protein n=1 Tax=Methyloceanibacter caenitepidi TaxID=1384459 RepID=A0A0A8K6R2_9HYPH|nr:DUF4339 domain-containing protein [Methyloceanibacter caenitepidi]BAQ18610.1 hypothetical protein GL4_3179 [Methyloceanibacter caenitepidi]